MEESNSNSANIYKVITGLTAIYSFCTHLGFILKAHVVLASTPYIHLYMVFEVTYHHVQLMPGRRRVCPVTVESPGHHGLSCGYSEHPS